MISSSHLFLGLPTAPFASSPMLRPGLHFAAFCSFISSLGVTRSSLLISISFSLRLDPARDIGCPHLFFGLSRASFYVFGPIFLFSSCRVDVFVGVFQEGDTSLSWSQSVFELLPSSVSPSEFWWQSFFCVFFFVRWLSVALCLFSSLLFFIFPCIFALSVQ